MIKYISRKDNIKVDVLSRRLKLNYEAYSKLIKLLLKKEEDGLRIINIIKENKDIIKEYHDNKLIDYLKIYKILKRV